MLSHFMVLFPFLLYHFKLMNPLFRKLAWQALLIGAVWFVIVVAVVLSALPRNPISLPYIPKLVIKTFVPEGWSFFTRSPRENLIYIYRKENGVWRQPSEVINGSVDNLLGASRKARAIGSEYALLFSLSGVSWESCESGSLDCVDVAKKITVHNQLRSPQLSGEYLFVSREPIPWAWSTRADKIQLPFQYVLVDFICK